MRPSLSVSKKVPFSAIVATSRESYKSSGSDAYKLISEFKVPHRRQIGGFRFLYQLAAPAFQDTQFPRCDNSLHRLARIRSFG